VSPHNEGRDVSPGETVAPQWQQAVADERTTKAGM
jgi:hypothetical protein